MAIEKQIEEAASRSSRVRLVVRGRVQGVGFRPSIYRFAREAGLTGFVRNTLQGVVIEVEGDRRSLARFARAMEEDLPPLARIDSMEVGPVEPSGDVDFTIEESDATGGADALFPVDTAVCADCLREMRDPGDRRYNYPFINCTNCGPRFTIIDGLPYDRPLTTMERFEMDSFCRTQYEDPADRRFHAEPISCPGCGPSLALVDAEGRPIEGDPLEGAVRLIEAGKIVAVKGLGGFHLACRADGSGAVSLLRSRKKRPVKPFALMFRDMDAIGRRCEVGEEERRLLLSPETPIVLLRERDGGLPGEIAPGNGYIGAFLPYTPVHHLMMERFEILVMTSANITDEPLISSDEELARVLGSIADAALTNDRPIAHKCDDSIFFVPAGEPVPVRRARGFVPEPVPAGPVVEEPIVALGGQEKGTFTVVRRGSGFVSPHLGDLGDRRSQDNYRRELESFLDILEVSPSVAVRDLHPDYFTSRLAPELHVEKVIGVQHHHAHAVSVMCEYGIEEPVIGVIFDGAGYGTDGRLWGCEFLLARPHDYRRLAHMRYVPLPGGEKAVREPWRMALMHLRNLRGREIPDEEIRMALQGENLPAGMVLRMAERGINSIEVSSMGRLFDAAACLLGCGTRVSYEAEAAIALESLALEGGPGCPEYRFGVSDDHPAIIDPAPVIEAMLGDISSGAGREDIALGFHRGVASLAVDLGSRLAGLCGCRTAVLGGGVFQNRVLCESIIELSKDVDTDFLMHRIVPPNDGGLSLGQARIAAAMLAG